MPNDKMDGRPGRAHQNGPGTPFDQAVREYVKLRAEWAKNPDAQEYARLKAQGEEIRRQKREQARLERQALRRKSK